MTEDQSRRTSPKSTAGGNQKPIVRVAGTDLHCAHLLFEAMTELRTKQSRQFVREYVALTKHWHRWVKLVSARFGEMGSPAYDLYYQDRYWTAVAIPREPWYPPPVELDQSQQGEESRRYRVVTAVSEELFSDWSNEEINGNGLFWRAANAVNVELHGWARGVWREANPDRKRRRSVARVDKFLAAVSAFAERWHLRAWWAEPAIVNHQFLLSQNTNWPFLGVFATGIGPPLEATILVPTPGAGPAHALADAEELWEWRRVEHIDDVRVEHFMEWPELCERGLTRGARCVWLDWDGSTRIESRFSGQQVLVTTAVREEMEAHLGRRLTRVEATELSATTTAKMDEIRDRWIVQGRMKVMGKSDDERAARWVARRLLDPAVTYQRLEILVGGRVGRDAIRKACDRFAAKARLDAWPI